MAAGTDKLDEIREAEAFQPVSSRKRQGEGEAPLDKSRNTLYEPDSADPDLQLRVVRSATQSIFEASREDERRQIGKRANRRRKRETFNSLMGTIKRKTFSSAHEKQPLSSRRDALNHPNRASAFHQEEQEAKAENFVEATPDQGGQAQDAESRRRRLLHVNVELSPLEKDKAGEPLVRYATNKVRTSKYTLLTFLPKVCFPFAVVSRPSQVITHGSYCDFWRRISLNNSDASLICTSSCWSYSNVSPLTFLFSLQTFQAHQNMTVAQCFRSLVVPCRRWLVRPAHACLPDLELMS